MSEQSGSSGDDAWLPNLASQLSRAIFTNTAATQLIKPELESGDITQRDYAAISQYYSDMGPRAAKYGTVSIILPWAIASLFRYRKIPLMSPRAFISIATSALAPPILQATMEMREMKQMYMDLENKEGVIRSLEHAKERYLEAVRGQNISDPFASANIDRFVAAAKQSQLPRTATGNASSESKETGSVFDSFSDPGPNFEESQQTQAPIQRQPQQESQGAPTPGQPTSRWDQLRGNSQTAKPSTWDSLRQQFESPAKTSGDPPPPKEELLIDDAPDYDTSKPERKRWT
ncbi:hypothetical protein CYLTODRAFT_447190 [Cylindrobasidium torrendii FP15055 ss-10]|uniref:Uncharacterized protein n=1 Tax=Cylindrobasidium torrendii FP15055 ss-10 TaxID=1314674 RepID=A0A0D7AW61_9AGAR|nr:hypothetical protein CYLTODRAFT_447190 [Cylindrobasidium torrendii FP15055 ss-10]